VLGALELADGPAELAAGGRVLGGGLQAPVRDPGRLGRGEAGRDVGDELRVQSLEEPVGRHVQRVGAGRDPGQGAGEVEAVERLGLHLVAAEQHPARVGAVGGGQQQDVGLEPAADHDGADELEPVAVATQRERVGVSPTAPTCSPLARPGRTSRAAGVSIRASSVLASTVGSTGPGTSARPSCSSTIASSPGP
jgi:hypothetical protein